MTMSADVTTAALPGQARPAIQSRLQISRKLLIFCWLAVFSLGALQAWDVRWALDPDGVAYLDMGDAFLRGNWHLALNALWPPLYPLLIGLTNWVVRPPHSLEIPVLHGLNLLIYLAAYGTFLLMLVELVRNQHRSAEWHQALPAFSNNAWLVLGTAIFTWATLTLVTIPEETPDMLAAVFIFLAFACLLRIRRQQAGWRTFVVLGAALALGYLSKYFMFGMAAVFLVVAVLAAGRWRQAWPRGLLALGTFLLVSAPFIVGLSRVKGHLEFNNSGTDAYLFHVDAVPFVNWQGGPPGTGSLIHPTREIDRAPIIYEYASPVSGTYPPWDDPDYWMAGGKPHFDIGGQLNILLDEALPVYVNMFVVSGAALLAGCLVLLALAGGWRQNLRALASEWVLLAPVLVAFGLFSVVHVETRYTVAFAAVLWLAVLAGVRLPAAAAWHPFIGRLVAVMAIVTLLVAGLPPAINTLVTVREWWRGRNPQAPDQWQVASALKARGIPEQDKIAVMGNAFHDAAWARLARLQIVAEIPQDQETAFWALDAGEQTQVMHLLADSGADVLVTEYAPSTAPVSWKRLGQTDYYTYQLPSP